MKHSRESQGANAHGLLLGLDLDGTLEVSNSFPLPHHINEDDDKSVKGVGESIKHQHHDPQSEWLLSPLFCVFVGSLAKYQASMLRSLKEVQADDSVVGFYQATTLGSFFSQSLVETQAIHQDRLRHGGVVVVHGKHLVLLNSGSVSSDRAFVDRYITNSTWQCHLPCFPINKSIFGRVQEEQFQYRKVHDYDDK